VGKGRRLSAATKHADVDNLRNYGGYTGIWGCEWGQSIDLQLSDDSAGSERIKMLFCNSFIVGPEYASTFQVLGSSRLNPAKNPNVADQPSNGASQKVLSLLSPCSSFIQFCLDDFDIELVSCVFSFLHLYYFIRWMAFRCVSCLSNVVSRLFFLMSPRRTPAAVPATKFYHDRGMV
jgi:hypothetical protein